MTFIACDVRAASLAVALLLAACAGSPPPPDWQANASAALDRAVAAYLVGDTKIATTEFDLARRELARTGRADLVALAELTRCAVRVASLDIGPCEGFESLRADTSAAERAYADYLAGRLQASDIALLPEQHRPIAAPVLSGDASVAALQAIDDPLARLVAASVLFQGSRANPAAISLAVETASDQGWRRPLLAWLGVQLALAENSGDALGAEQVRRRIALVSDVR
jgi:hypothetical protein